MLVTFKTSAYSDITMFGSAAVALLKLMGMSGNVPGAIMAEDVPQALESLQQGLSKLAAGNDVSDDNASDGDNEDNDDAANIGLDKRAGPLVSLLEAAVSSQENVMWDS